LNTIDPIKLEIWWSRLVAITDEAALALLRTAFSTIIRESNDYTVVLLSSAGETLAECQAGIPAFAAVMGSLTRKILDRFPVETWRDGDCVMTNDPWLATGHLPDISLVCPIFYKDRLVGFTATAAHVPDIGGNAGMGPGDLRSEGLLIPPVKLLSAGQQNDAILDLLLSNVRLADQVRGDLEAQIAANDVCRRRAVEFLESVGEHNFEALARAIHEKAESVMRAAIAALPDGTYRSTTMADGVDGHPTRIECAITVSGDQLTIDYAGSSTQVAHGINCTMTYTTAYSLYLLKILLDPFTRRNHGSYRSVSVNAPEGSILNARFPAGVRGRHLTGHLLSCAIYRALEEVLPNDVIADSGGSPALRVHFGGRDATGREFGLVLFASAGMGASSWADGLSTTAFPTNSGAGSIESLESTAPLLFMRKEFRPDSGGAGLHRGGLGQDIEVLNLGPNEVRVLLLGERERHPALGLHGGHPGAPAAVKFEDGRTASLKSVAPLAAGTRVTISFAGGGGYGDPAARDRAAVVRDLVAGLITPAAAEREYVYEVDESQMAAH
jgi:N-methylhydantoinase B